MNRLGILVSFACLVAMATCAGNTGERLVPSISLARLGASVSELSKAPVDFKTAQRWFLLSQKTNVPVLRQKFLKLSATAMLYSRRADVYTANVRQHITGVQSFEESLRSDCGACVDGKVEVECKHCRGTGKCQNEGCDHGWIRVRIRKVGHLSANTDGAIHKSEKCPSCSGTGECRYCKGRKTLETECAKCGGKGWTIRPDDVLYAYRVRMDELLGAVRKNLFLLAVMIFFCVTFPLWLFWHPDWRKSKW